MPLPHDAAGSTPPGTRTGASPVERQAIARALVDVAAMPPSDVVQLALWPETIADWARGVGVAPAVAYNMLARFKPYRRVRELLARRLDVPGFVLDHLVDAERPLPSAMRATGSEITAPGAPTEPGPLPPTLRLPALRDGTNPIEVRAVWRVWTEIAALPASLVVQLALFPETLAEWARRRELPASLVYATLADSQRNPRVRDALARRLGVATAAVDELIDGLRAEPRALTPPMLADAPPPPSTSPPPESPAERAAPRRPDIPGADDERQLTFGF